MIEKLSKTYHQFPPKFWVLMIGMFIDRIGGTMLFPFMSLYITKRFDVGMATAGVVLGIFSLSGLVGSFLGGALTDKFGRRSIILFGLVFSALSSLTLGLVNHLAILYPLAIIIGLLGSISDPAHAAMVADMLPENKRSDGFGMLRVVANLSWIIGPTIGGLIASQSYFMLFVLDAITSCVMAVIIYKLIPETMPQRAHDEQKISIGQTIAGYAKVLTDRPYLGFLMVSILVGLVYGQMYNTLSVYMRDVHGFTAQQYGLVLSSSAVTVVLFQLWITGRTRSRPPFLMMALGVIFYVVGFTMFGIFNPFIYFIVAVVVITVGEMIIMPISQALAAKFAPEDMRGRYMGTYSLVWAIPSTIGPGLAGFIMDNYNPNLVWIGGGGILVIAAFGFLLLHSQLHKQERFTPSPELTNAAVSED